MMGIGEGRNTLLLFSAILFLCFCLHVSEKVRGSPTGADWTQKSSTLLFKAAIFTAT